MADSFSQIVSGYAHIRALIWFAAAAVNYSQEEEGAAGQQHAVRTRVVPVGLHPLSILVPLHGGRGPPLGLAIEGGRLALRNDQVRGMLHDAGRVIFLPQTGSWRIHRGQSIKTQQETVACDGS